MGDAGKVHEASIMFNVATIANRCKNYDYHYQRGPSAFSGLSVRTTLRATTRTLLVAALPATADFRF
jgi:hypothetical protein